MIGAAPIAAMVWENWRLTRVEAALRVGQAVVACSAALLLFGNGATVAFWILLTLHAFFYLSIAKLNGGRFMDGYKPGFPLYLLYTRPVPTAAFVSVAMLYDAITSAVSYLLIAALLMFVFGQPLPLLPVALLLVALHLGMTCIQWSTRSRVIQFIGTVFISWPGFFLLRERATSPHEIEFSFAEYALMFLFGVVSIVFTAAGVARQRRGEAVATAPRPAGSGGYPDWLVNLFRFPCPTSSATKAQVWFELKSSGIPVLLVGLGISMLIFLLFAISIPLEILRPFAIFAVMASAPTLLLLLGGNAFGIRRRQGRTYASAFELTRPYGTSQMVGLKVMLRTACVLVALIAVGASVWVSSSMVGAWGSWWVEGGKDAVPGLLKQRQEFGDAVRGLMGHSLAAHAVITSVGVAVMVALLAVFAAVRARYTRRLIVAGSLLLSHGLALILLALAEQKGLVPQALVATAFAVTGWTLVMGMSLATLYLIWSGIAERVLTLRYASTAVVSSIAFAVAWLTVLQAAGLQVAGMSAAQAVSTMWPVLLPLLASVLAPWSLSRTRHA